MQQQLQQQQLMTTCSQTSRRQLLVQRQIPSGLKKVYAVLETTQFTFSKYSNIYVKINMFYNNQNCMEILQRKLSLETFETFYEMKNNKINWNTIFSKGSRIKWIYFYTFFRIRKPFKVQFFMGSFYLKRFKKFYNSSKKTNTLKFYWIYISIYISISSTLNSTRMYTLS